MKRPLRHHRSTLGLGNMQDHEPRENAPEGEENSRRERSLEEVLGIPREYAPEELAPPIQRDKLKAFIARTLVGGEREEILAMIATFQSWHDAWIALRRETFEGPQENE